MANYEATKYDFSGANLQGIEGVNTGLIVPWGNNSTPSGFLDCDGAAVSRTTYSALFAIISTTYGVGDGSTTFNLPDLTDRTIVGKSGTKTLASTGGANAVTGTGNVSGSLGNTTLTTPTIAAHNHSYPGGFNGPSSPGPAACNDETMSCAGIIQGGGTSAVGGGGAHSHPVAATFAGGSDSVLQPSATIKYIIKT